MKTYIKEIACLVVLLCCVVLCPAETVHLSFSGTTTEGRRCLLDSVKIENLTNEWEQTFDCTQDTAFEVELTEKPEGIDDVAAPADAERLLSVSQNYTGDALLAVRPARDGVVRLQVTDMLGQMVMEHAEYLCAGYHQFALHIGAPQVYVLSVFAGTESASAKVVGMSQSGGFSLDRVSSIQSAPRRVSRTAPQNMMRYTGYTTQKGAVVASTPVTQEQSSDEHIVLYFAPVSKSQEGMYVGMMGFNSQLYPFAFGKMTSSNLTTYQQFVSNLNMANGTILYHAVYTALDNITKAPVPQKLENVSLVTFTDGLDIGSYRLNDDYPSGQLYLDAVNKQIHRTYIDGIALDAYAIGVKGSDVSDIARFESDLHKLASDSANVFSVSNMEEVNARFRDIAAKIYNAKTLYSLTIQLPAQEPGSVIRFTFDNINDAANSIYYIEGIYGYDFSLGQGVLNNVSYYGVKCSNGSIWNSTPDGIFDLFTVKDLTDNLGMRLPTNHLQQWVYIPSTGKWQVNSEFAPATNITTQEERTSALVMLVLDCSSSLGSDFSQMQTSAKTFLSILTGSGSLSKPSVSAASTTIDYQQVTMSANITNAGNLSVLDKGFCVSEYPNMDSAVFYSAGAGADNFEYVLTNPEEDKTYYYCPYAENAMGKTYGNISSFVYNSATFSMPSVSAVSTSLGYLQATMSANITNTGNLSIIDKGFCVSEYPNMDSAVLYSAGAGIDSFEYIFTDPKEGVTYYCCAYAENALGRTYGDTSSFVYSNENFSKPSVDLSIIMYTSKVRLMATIVSTGNLSIIDLGFCVSEFANMDSAVVHSFGAGGRTGEIFFSSIPLDSLIREHTYYCCVYAENAVGRAYSDTLSFTMPTLYEGALIGEFSVSATTKVHFSKGNLQYVGTWQFAEHQWDYFGSSQSNIHRDLFGWGTGNAPNKSSTDNSDYATFTDWGINRITNGGNEASAWRTLTKSEWYYLFCTRENAATLFGLGRVNGVNGTILLPDNWILPAGASFTASTTQGLVWRTSAVPYAYVNTNGDNFSHNIYTAAQWEVMEAAGAVFLPAGGSRRGTNVNHVGQMGFYWSATIDYSEAAYNLNFRSNYLFPSYTGLRHDCFSVRLVR